MFVIPGPNQEPTIDILTPNGNEHIMGGSAYLITWDMNDQEDPDADLVVELEYSSTGAGGPWIPITTVTGVESYNWDPVPLIDSPNCYIRANVTDTGGLYAIDMSDLAFEIDSTAPLPATAPYAELDGLGVHVYWTASPSSDVVGYEVWWRMNGFDPTGDTYISFIDAAMNTDVLHANVGVNNPQTYTYQIRTFDDAGHETRTLLQAAKFGSTQSVFTRDPDWFLLGNPLQMADTSIGNVLQGQGLPGNWDCVRTFDAPSQTWATQVKSNPRTTITNIDTDQGFWMHITNSVRFCTAGTLVDKNIPMSTGWNLVAYPFGARSMNTASIEAHLIANCPGYVGMLVEDLTDPYHLKTPAGSEVIFHNMGFWVQVSMDTSWNVVNY
jgi:hypothetical protein